MAQIFVSTVAHFFVSASGSKFHERMAHFFIDIYTFAKKAYDEQYADLSRRLDEAVQRKVKFAEAMSEDNK